MDLCFRSKSNLESESSLTPVRLTSTLLPEYLISNTESSNFSKSVRVGFVLSYHPKIALTPPNHSISFLQLFSLQLFRLTIIKLFSPNKPLRQFFKYAFPEHDEQKGSFEDKVTKHKSGPRMEPASLLFTQNCSK